MGFFEGRQELYFGNPGQNLERCFQPKKWKGFASISRARGHFHYMNTNPKNCTTFRENPSNLDICMTFNGWESGSPKRWDRWHSPSPKWQYHLYTTHSPCLLGGYMLPTTLYRNLKKSIDIFDSTENGSHLMIPAMSSECWRIGENFAPPPLCNQESQREMLIVHTVGGRNLSNHLSYTKTQSKKAE